MRNLLSTKWGRLSSFFLLYVTEGIPLGLTAVAIAAQMRRRGVDVTAIGAFVATLYLPWSWKFLFGPIVDLVHSQRLGRRRGWILICQLAMAATLLAAMPIDFATHLTLFTWIIIIHNVFGAIQDIAIDALAVTALSEAERGLANGLMFAGAYIGNAIGGAGVLFLTPWIGFNSSFILAASVIILVTLLVTLRLREPPHQTWGKKQRAGLRDIGRELIRYLDTLLRIMFFSRAAFLIFLFALLPTGAYALGLALSSSLSVELGLTDQMIALLSLISMVCAAAGCVLGGMLSDKWGRRRMLAIYTLLTAIPTICFAFYLIEKGWIFPIDPRSPSKPIPPQALIIAFWIAALIFSFIRGLMYGTRTALFMDLCASDVVATQFTAYMSLLNLGIAYSAWWQGFAIKRWGYPTTLLLDAAIGCLCLILLPFLRRPPQAIPAAEVVRQDRGVLEYS